MRGICASTILRLFELADVWEMGDIPQLWGSIFGPFHPHNRNPEVAFALEWVFHVEMGHTQLAFPQYLLLGVWGTGRTGIVTAEYSLGAETFWQSLRRENLCHRL